MPVRPTSVSGTPIDPTLSVAEVHGRTRALVRGDWTLATSTLIERLVSDIDAPRGAELVLDLGALGHLDTAGALLLNRLIVDHAAAGGRVKVLNVGETHRILIEEVRDHDKPPPVATPSRPMPIAMLERLGAIGVMLASDAGQLLTILGGAVTHLVRWLARPARFRFRSFVHHLDRACLQAAPIVALMSFLIGGIIAQQGAFYFRRFGADLYVVDMVGVLVLREIGVLLTAILVAGRSGSAFTAELGSMKMREEVDALRVIGLDPIEVLVLPRLLALVVAMPILTFIANFAAVFGAVVVAAVYAGIPADTFLNRLMEAVTVETLNVGLSKAPFMALIIGLISCSEGLKVKGSAESLGHQTTMSVVKAIFMVIVVDGAFAVFFAATGI
jgi:phospholipid/cholesterol/gamma-HCH transport system permease protein